MLVNCSRNNSDFTGSIPTSCPKGIGKPGDSGNNSEGEGFAFVSVRNVVATPNWPSRNRCIAMARLINPGGAERASLSVDGKGLSLNF